MAYISTIQTGAFRSLRDVDIDLPGDEQPQHLIITGPNASGKTSLLEFIHQTSFGLGWTSPVEAGKVLRAGSKHGIRVPLNPDATTIYFPATRNVAFKRAPGPKQFDLNPGVVMAEYFVQFLVNQKAKQAFSSEEGDQETRAQVMDWFARLQTHLGNLLSDPDLRLRFNASDFTFTIRANEQESPVYDLADGHRSALHIFSELLLRQEMTADELEAVVLIDEIETHLHLELQETILPFLISMFPRSQFIVATHSPAVIASIPNAVVYDLATQKQTNSSEYRGMRYGTLMKAHFGLDEDFDLETTRELQTLKALRNKEGRTPAENERLLQIANHLSAKSHMAALEVLLEMEAQKVAQ